MRCTRTSRRWGATINGYLYGNGPMPTVHIGEHVRWYVFSLGTEVDLHTPHWHGNTVTVNGRRTDLIELLPATVVTADMVPDDKGVCSPTATSTTTSRPACRPATASRDR